MERRAYTHADLEADTFVPEPGSMTFQSTERPYTLNDMAIDTLSPQLNEELTAQASDMVSQGEGEEE